MAASQASASKGQQIDLGTLSAQQLMQVKKQLDDELEHLNSSYNQLRAAQAKFQDCINSLQTGVKGTGAKSEQILVPLTTSLYVPGRLADRDKVLVDVGTGFYVEKSVDDAEKFYKGKIEELSSNLKDLEGILQQKSNNLRVVEDVLRQKVVQGQSLGGAPGQGGQEGAAAVS